MARVIKGGVGATQAAPLAARVLKAAAVDARAEARALLDAARAEADGVRAAAEAAGRAAARAEAGALLVAAEAAAARRAADEGAALGTLATKIAARLLGRELALRPEAVVDVVETALAEAAERRRITVRVAPADRARVEAELARLGARVPGAALAVEADETLAPGDCVLDTEVGRIDARLDVQLAAIARVLG